MSDTPTNDRPAEATAEPAAPEGRSRLLLGAFLPSLLGIAIGVVIAGALLLATGERQVSGLAAGDCFDLGEKGGAVAVAVVPCDGPHDREVFARVTATGDAAAPYPGTEALVAQADAACAAPFGDYVGVPYEASPLRIAALLPTPAEWSDGNRLLVCAVASDDATPLTGSVRAPSAP